MSECRVYRREIAESVDDAALSVGARAHASLCRACGGELHARESLRALIGDLGRVEAPADFEFRLRARLAAAKGAGGRGRFGGLRLIYGFAPVVAAACFLVISATLYFKQAARTSPASQPAAVETARRVDSVEVAAIPGHVESAEPDGGVVQSDDEKADAANSRVRASSHKARARVVRVEEAASKSVAGGGLAANTVVNSFGSARVLRPVVTIAVQTPAEPLRMILRDERGAERVVSMRSVSFGSQAPLARDAALQQSAAAQVEGVW